MVGRGPRSDERLDVLEMFALWLLYALGSEQVAASSGSYAAVGHEVSAMRWDMTPVTRQLEERRWLLPDSGIRKLNPTSAWIPLRS